jgi:hypothetical protein
MAALAILFFRLATFSQQINPVDPGPAFYPRLISALLLVAATAQMIRTWREGAARGQGDSSRRGTWASAASRYSLGTLGLSILYVSVFNKAPYLVTTTAFLLALMALAGVRRWTILCGAALGYALVTYYVFGQILMVPLP